jgi:ElaA protein
MAWDGNKLAAYSRIVPPGARYAEPSIGRVLTSAEYRGTGLGRELMRRAIEHTEQLYPEQPIRIGAQAHLQRFYNEFGFVTDSDIYFEDHIEHVKMLRVMN